MTIDQAVVGARVRSSRHFSGVPEGTEGVIDQDYDTGFIVAWDLLTHPLPAGYKAYDGVPAVVSGILRDGFDKQQELSFLELVRPPLEAHITTYQADWEEDRKS